MDKITCSGFGVDTFSVEDGDKFTPPFTAFGSDIISPLGFFPAKTFDPAQNKQSAINTVKYIFFNFTTLYQLIIILLYHPSSLNSNKL